MNKVAAFALRRKNSILSMSEKMFCPPQPLCFWITPACAGKRRSDWIIRSIYWDHPRMCGEKPAMMVCSLEYWGSPPRMRGKVDMGIEEAEVVGITPAYAGKRTKPAWNWLRARDHPRVCGEKTPVQVMVEQPKGSPPRMRGKGKSVCKNLGRVGISPAYAGKRRCWAGCKLLVWDHPRVCGEKNLWWS